jgi:hypothetical protein
VPHRLPVGTAAHDDGDATHRRRLP